MESLTEREAIRRFLAAYAALAPIERRCRRIETAVAIFYSVAILVNIALPAVEGFAPLDLVSYALACVLALLLRRWVLSGIARRRAWQIWEIGVVHARARLAFLDGLSRPERPRLPA